MRAKQIYSSPNAQVYMRGDITKNLIIMVISICYVSLPVMAIGNPVAFQTGPFNGTVDFGLPCPNLEILPPENSEMISGLNYTTYIINSHEGGFFFFNRFNETDVPQNFAYLIGMAAVSDLLDHGAEKDSILVFNRSVSGRSGVVASGYVPHEDMVLYQATFFVSNNTVGHITVWENETMMSSILRSLKVSES